MNDPAAFIFLKRRDEGSFAIFFETYYRPLVAYITQYTNDFDEAEDIAQNCFVAIWEKRKKLDINTSLKSYLYGAAYNLFIDKYRKNKKMNDYIENIKHSTLQEIFINEPDDSLAKQLKFLDKTISELPEKCRRIFIMSKKDGKSYKEIAEQLEISVKTVEAQIRIALIKIRERFESTPSLGSDRFN
jgi:RNA polymerase sigma-70 factor (ECF subfamily)